MTTEEMNESSWRTHEKLIKTGQNDDDVEVIEYRWKKRNVNSEFGILQIRQVGMTVDQEYVLQEDGDNRNWSKKIVENIIIRDNVNVIMQDNEVPIIMIVIVSIAHSNDFW